MDPPRPATRGDRAALDAVLLAALVLRSYDLGRLSFWYDEVVTMRLARTAGPLDLLRKLPAIDATRAPLHPLLLQPWLALFGRSEAVARGFSVACGLGVVWLTYKLGRALFDDARTALVAATFAAVSPPLVAYAREARMYAWLGLVTCAAWLAQLGLGGVEPWRPVAYAACLVALGYTHPLGLLMAASLALASLLNRRALGLSWSRWFWPHAAAGSVLLPWLPNYLDHPPEWTVGRLGPKYLLGLPIGFLGGNFWVLGVFGVVIVYGLFRWPRRGAGAGTSPGATGGLPTSAPGPRRGHGWASRQWLPEMGAPPGHGLALDRPVAAVTLLTWLTVAPVLLYAYSWVGHPVFGPERYTLFVAPAYLLLVARGLARLPFRAGLAASAVVLGLAVSGLPARVYAPDLKSDWRAAVAVLDEADHENDEPLVVTTNAPGRNFEAVAAEYYAEDSGRRVVPMPDDPARLDRVLPAGTPRYWLTLGVRGGRPVIPTPAVPGTPGPAVKVPGLRLVPYDR